MASIPPQFADTRLQQQLTTARGLRDRLERSSPELYSGITALDECFADVRPGDLVEWGIPPGLNGRLIPLQLLKVSGRTRGNLYWNSEFCPTHT